MMKPAQGGAPVGYGPESPGGAVVRAPLSPVPAPGARPRTEAA